jgi:hypothetical protein
MVSVKIDNKVIENVTKIKWNSQLIFEWPTTRVYNQIGGIYFKKPFAYTPAPVSRNKKDKVYGAYYKSKPQLSYMPLKLTEVVELGGHTFRLWNHDEQVAFGNLFTELYTIDSLK